MFPVVFMQFLWDGCDQTHPFMKTPLIKCFSALAIALIVALSLVSARATELIVNGGVESGSSPWVLSGGVTASANGGYARSGSYFLFFGGANNEVDAGYQTIMIPANATAATLSFYYNINSLEGNTVARDTFSATIRDTNGTFLATVLNLSNNDQTSPGPCCYTLWPYNLLPYAGQTIRIHFASSNNASRVTNFRVDDVSVQVTTGETISIPTGLSGEPNPVQNVSSTYLVNASTSSLGHTVEYSFTWGDGTSSLFSTSTSASHAWSSTGQKYVYVTARCQTHTSISNNNSPGKFVTVQPPSETITTPGTIAGTLSPVQGTPYSYTVGTATSSLGHTVEYSFDWGDGSSPSFSTSATATHTWFSTGQKSIIVTARCQTHTGVSNNNSPGKSITVTAPTPAPVAVFATDNRTPQPGQAVRFYATSPVAGVTYSWFIDNSLITAGTASSTYLTFNSSGTHPVKLVASDSQSRSDTQSADIYVQSSVSGTGGGGSSGNTRPTLGADPVNLASGSYTYEHTDLRFPGVGIPFEFSRSYNSKFNDQSGLPFGYGWSYFPSIRVSDNLTNAVVTFGDGHAETFTTTGGSYVGAAGVFDLLVKNPDASWLVITKQQTTNLINTAGRLVQIQDRNGNAITLDYETDDLAANGRLKQIVDTAKRTNFFRGYPGNSALIGSIEDALQRTNFFTYDSNTNLVAVTNAMQAVTQFTYDGKHQLTGLQDNRGSLIVSNIYDPDLNVVIRQFDAYGKEVGFNYDFTNHVTIQTNALGGISIYQFDDQLLLTNQVNEAGFTNAYAYDSARNQVLIRDRNGNETHYVFDERGNVTNKLDAVSKATSIRYSAFNKPISRLDALANPATLGYDTKGNLNATTNALGFVSRVQYNANGLPLILTDARGFNTTNQYDAAGNLVAVMDAKGFTSRFEYDAVGRKLGQIDALNRTNLFFYDNNDNLLYTVNALGFTNFHTYDANNNRTSSRNPRNATITNSFDLKDRLVNVVAPLNQTVSNRFDELDRKIASFDSSQNPTGYTYDGIGNVIAVTNALTQTIRFTFDAQGNPTSLIDPPGHYVTNFFDPLNRKFAGIDVLISTNAPPSMPWGGCSPPPTPTGRSRSFSMTPAAG